MPLYSKVRLLIEPDEALFDEFDYRVHKGAVGMIIESYTSPKPGYCVDFTDPNFDDGHGNSCSFLDLTEDQIEAVEEPA